MLDGSPLVDVDDVAPAAAVVDVSALTPPGTGPPHPPRAVAATAATNKVSRSRWSLGIVVTGLS